MKVKQLTIGVLVVLGVAVVAYRAIGWTVSCNTYYSHPDWYNCESAHHTATSTESGYVVCTADYSPYSDCCNIRFAAAYRDGNPDAYIGGAQCFPGGSGGCAQCCQKRGVNFTAGQTYYVKGQIDKDAGTECPHVTATLTSGSYTCQYEGPEEP